jgi:hypothetical protein
VQNYSSTRSGTAIGTGLWTFGIDGNLTLAGNVICPSNSYIFGDFSNAIVNSRTVFTPSAANASPGIYAAPSGSGTGASWQAANSANLTAASKILIATNGSTDVQLVSGINGSGTYLPLSFYNNGAAQMQLTVAGNLNMTVNNSVATSGTGYFIGNAVGTTAAYTGNVNAAYFIGDGSQLTGIASGGSNYSNVNTKAYTETMGFQNYGNVNVAALITTNGLTNYSNVNVAAYIPSYAGNIANVRLGTSGILTFPDGTQQTTAAFGGGGNYGNANVAAFLPTYTGTTGITQIGTLATLSVTGNATVGNLVGTEANTRIIANVYTTTFDIYGNVSFPGNIITPTGLYVGPTLFTALPNTIAQFTGNANSYAQINFENLSSGTDATADYIATANNGTDTTFFVDLGITNNNYDNASPTNSLGTAVFANDSYLYAQGNLATTTGGNLVIGTSTANKSVKIFAGGINSANIVATVSNTGVAVTGNVSATNFVGSGSLLSGVAIKTTGSWTVPTGNSTQSFTVASGTYQLWVDCNIPNGILAWNAIATVTNSNVPVVGQQFAWVYNGGGTPIDFTSIPNQFVGTGNTIVRSSVSPSATTNRFDFGINNTSGGNVTVSYGYAKIS